MMIRPYHHERKKLRACLQHPLCPRVQISFAQDDRAEFLLRISQFLPVCVRTRGLRHGDGRLQGEVQDGFGR